MPIQLIRDDERLIYQLEDSKIFYRRISTSKRSKIVANHTKRGKTDWVAVTRDLAGEIIIGWENVVDGGKEIPFSKDLVTRIPDEVLSEILQLSGAAIGEEDGDAEKN
jgi:hypothetical protein